MQTSPSPISLPDLVALREGGGEFALFDVREAGEAHRGHIHGATFLPRRQLELRIAGLVPRLDTPIVVCDGGRRDTRAARAAQSLAGLGYTNVRALAGGTRGWQESGRALSEGSNVPSKLFGEEVHESDNVPRIPAKELARWQAEGRPHLVCDIRSPEEYARSHIPGARGAYGTDLALLAADLRAAGKPVVVHCSGRTRSIIACQGLRALGVPEVYALENGTMGWQLAGLELERDAGAGVLVPSTESASDGERAARALALAAGARTLGLEAFAGWMRERAKRQANVYPIDVRQVAEYVEGHVPGSIAVPGGLALQRADEFVPVRAGRIVLIDRREARAWLAAYWLCRMGFAHVQVLEGGIEAWVKGGGTLEPGRGRTRPAGWEGVQRIASYVTPGDLQPQIRNTLLLNVDTSRQFAKARLPGSSWVRYGDLEDHMAGVPGPDRARTVLTCRDGTLSTLAAANLAREGIAGVRVLAGGVGGWRGAGYEIESGEDAATRDAGDLVVQPYDSGREGMQRYLDWEQKLTAQAPH
ncbi:MAG: rhodanese-like domain-containing protein [Proteobacteria bacterium]|nr:rhodanese-like domain-containing protein [Pseudomonadota bacterium]